MNIVVYCSSKEEIAQEYKDAAAEIGRWIGESGNTLVYGGINMGLMKIIAAETRRAGGRAVGVVPVTASAMAFPENDEVIPAQDLNDRKTKMIAMGGAFVALAGGYGTLDELMATFALLTYTGNTAKHIILLNQNGLYDHTVAQFREMAAQGLLSCEAMRRISVASSAEECCEILKRLTQNQE